MSELWTSNSIIDIFNSLKYVTGNSPATKHKYQEDCRMNEGRIANWVKLCVIWCFALALVIVGHSIGCSSPTPTNDGGITEKTPDEKTGLSKEGEACNQNSDCEVGLECKDNKCAKPSTQPECKTDADCKDPSKPKCENQKCVAPPTGCKTDADCPPGQKCVEEGGQKICKKPESSDITKVEIITPGGVIRQGQKRQFEAIALNASGARVTGPHKFKWTSSDPSVAKIDADSGELTGDSKDGTTNIIAEINEIKSAPVSVRNFAAVAAGKVRVIVLDGKGNAIAQAKVKIADKEADTDASGAAVIESTETSFDVHVFHNDYSYFSAFGVTKNDLFIQLARNVDNTKAGGAKGKFNFDKLKDILGISDDDWLDYAVGFGIAGLSLPLNILDLNFEMLIGEQFKVSLFGQKLTLPSGLVIELAAGGKDEYQAQGEEGSRLLWGFGGKFKLAEVLALIPSDTKNVNVAEILGKAKPLLSRMGFGFQPDVNVSLHPKVKDVDDKNGNGKTDDLIPDFTKFIDKNLPLQYKLDQKIALKIANVPSVQHAGKPLDLLVIGLAGAIIPGLGLVPTGLMVEQSQGGAISMEVPYSKGEGILTSGQYATVSIALTLPIGDNPPPLYLYGDIQLSQTPPSSVSVPNFVEAPDKAKFDPATRKLAGSSAQGASLFHFSFVKDGKQWVVVYAGDKNSFELPVPPTGFADRISVDGDASLRAVVLKSGQSLDSLLEFNTLNMDRITDVISGFSNVVVYEKP